MLMTKQPAILYISYDGLLEPLGQSQVLAYLEILAAHYRIHLISFEKPKDLRDKRKVEALRNRTDAAGIRWRSLTYHKAPSTLATAWDIFVGGMVAVSMALRHQIRDRSCEELRASADGFGGVPLHQRQAAL